MAKPGQRPKNSLGPQALQRAWHAVGPSSASVWWRPGPLLSAVRSLCCTRVMSTLAHRELSGNHCLKPSTGEPQVNPGPGTSENPVLDKKQRMEHQKTYKLSPGKAGEVVLSQVLKKGTGSKPASSACGLVSPPGGQVPRACLYLGLLSRS